MLHFFSQHLDQVGQACLAIGILLLGYIQKRYFTKVETKADQIHVLVNSRLTDALDRIDELEKSFGVPSGAPIPGTVERVVYKVDDSTKPKV